MSESRDGRNCRRCQKGVSEHICPHEWAAAKEREAKLREAYTMSESKFAKRADGIADFCRQSFIEGAYQHYLDYGHDLSFFRTENENLRQAAKELVEALEETLASLVSYKKYVPEPYKQNPIYIIGSYEAEKKAIKALAAYKARTEGK